MLTIHNHNKLMNAYINDDWWVKYVYENPKNDTYVFSLEKMWHGSIMDTCTIMLERTGIVQNYISKLSEIGYYFIYQSQRTNVCVTADYIADKDNMLGQLEYLLKENGKIN